MSKFWIGAVVAVLAAGAAAAYVTVMRSGGPDLGPVGPNRDLAPETLAVYVELPDLASTWKQMQTTEAWVDLGGSKIVSHVRDLAPVKDFLAAVDEVSKKAAYPVDATNAMKFVGRECSVGVALDGKGGSPNILVLTKLDVDALKKDLLTGETDLRALWTEMQKRTGQCEFVVTPEEYKEHTIANAAKGASKFHAALIGDTLAVATDVSLVRAAIDCRLSRGEHSIGRRTTFQADVKALPAGATAFEWYDLDALAANRASVDAGLAALGTPPEAPAALHAVLDATAGAHSIARAEVVPAGDLYRATWTYSKSADLFVDKAAPAPRSLFAGEWMVYGEMHDVGAVADAWDKSALRRNLGAGEIGKWLDKTMAEPAAELKKALDWIPGKRATRPVAAPVARAPRTGKAPVKPAGAPPKPAPPAAPTQKPAALAEAADEYLDEFAARMGYHLLVEELQALVNGDAAVSVSAPLTEGDTPRVAWAVRLDVEGRLFAVAAQAAALQSKEAGIACEDCGTRKLFSAEAPNAKVHWTLVGDTLVLSNDKEFVRQAALGGDTKPVGPSPAIRDAAAAFKPGWRGFVYVDVDRAMTAMERTANSGRPSGGPPSPFDSMRKLGGMGREIAVAAYVADDFSSAEIRTRTDMGDPKDSEMLRVLQQSPAREPLCWTSLPDTTFLHSAYTSSGVDLIWFVTKTAISIAGGDLHKFESEFREKMDMDLEKDLLPALGHEISVSVTYNAVAAPPPPGAPPGAGMPAFPGLLIGVEVRDAAKIRKAVDRAVELAEQSMQSDRPPDASHKVFVREPREGIEMLRLDLPPEQGVPVHPALAVEDGYLFLASDVDVLRAAIDTSRGKGKRFSDSALFVDAATVLGRKCVSFGYVDWPRLLDQVAVYAPQLGGLVASDDVKYPEFPENGDNTEWRRRVADYEKKKAESKKSGEPKVKAWIDSARVVEYVGSNSGVSGNFVEGTMVVKFKK